MMPNYLRKKDLLQLLNISSTTLETWLKKGKMPQPTQIDRIRLWNSSQIAAWMESKKKPAAA